jgi:hypothetical protein
MQQPQQQQTMAEADYSANRAAQSKEQRAQFQAMQIQRMEDERDRRKKHNELMNQLVETLIQRITKNE